MDLSATAQMYQEYSALVNKEHNMAEKHEMADFTLEAILKAMKAIQLMVEDAESDGWYVTGPIGLKCADGWSPGYFTLTEDWVSFVPEYTEEER